MTKRIYKSKEELDKQYKYIMDGLDEKIQSLKGGYNPLMGVTLLWKSFKSPKPFLDHFLCTLLFIFFPLLYLLALVVVTYGIIVTMREKRKTHKLYDIRLAERIKNDWVVPEEIKSKKDTENAHNQ